MSDELLRAYDRELTHLRRMGAEFAAAHPKIAGRLRMGADTIEDPHVQRLMESVAFLNARIRRKLDDEFPELTDALLGVLYPHLVAPIPSMSIAQFEAEPDLTAGFTIPRGTQLETARVRGEPCRFQTAYPVESWPIRIDEARWMPTPFAAPATGRSAQAAAALRITLRTLMPTTTFAQLSPKQLRFFLKGSAQHVHPLYEHLFNHAVEIAVATSAKDKHPALISKDCIRPVGFDENEGLLPYPRRSFLGYRLISELFAFPHKFLFFDLAALPAHKLAECGATLDIYVYFDHTTDALEQYVQADSFALSCTPIVNLFQRHAEPIRLLHETSEPRVVPDARRPMSTEVYSVDRVTLVSASGETRRALPFYGLDHGGDLEDGRTWWHPVRRASSEVEGKIDHGTEVFLRFVDLDFVPSAPAGWTADVEVTCLNRDMAAALPFGADEPRLQFSQGGGPVRRIRCLTAPTRTLRPPLGGAAMWRLVSQLLLNQLSLQGDEGTAALREILGVYDLTGSRDTRGMIEGIAAVSSRPTSMRVISGGQPGLARGTEVTVELDETRFSGGGSYLFGCVLERFLGLYCSANSFVQLILKSNARREEVKRWRPRAGDRTLL